MIININSDSTWYTGTDMATPAGQYDLVTVALHQIAHGLGIVGTANYDDGIPPVECTGSPGTGCYATTQNIYDHFIENGGGAAITSFTNVSAALATQLISGNLFFNGTNANAANGSTNPQIEATNPFTQATDYSFLDETVFPAGNPHSLLTPIIGTAEAIHDPGDILRGMLKDIGWTIADAPVAAIDVRRVFYTGMSLSFGDASSQSTSWEWDFENDAVVDATTQNPSHTYTTAGTYSVRLAINGNPALDTIITVQIFDLPTIPYTQNFESGIAGFYEVSEGCDLWELGSANKANFNSTNGYIGTNGGFNSWVTNLNTSHGLNTEYYLESPPFDFTNTGFDYYLNFNYRYLSTNSGFNLQYSTDGGNTWLVLGIVGDPLGTDWYTTANMTELGNEDGWSPTPGFSVINPTREINIVKGFSDVRFRFKFGARNSFLTDGVQIDDFQITRSVLDVEGLEFDGYAENNQVYLNWTTIREIENDYFEVEKSMDAINFQPIGKVAGNGTTSETSEYEFIDSNPQVGLNYYRLKQVNKSGSFVHSNTIQLTFEPQASISLFPNPASNFIDLQIYQKGEQEIDFRLFTLSGKSVISFEDRFSEEFSRKMDISSLPSGIYLYEAKLNEEVVRGKLVIAR